MADFRAEWEAWNASFERDVRTSLEELAEDHRRTGEEALASALPLFRGMRSIDLPPPTRWNMSEEGILSIECERISNGMLIVLGSGEVGSHSMRESSGYFQRIHDFIVSDGLPWKTFIKPRS